MEMNNDISGKYMHYKSKQYEVYCLAFDTNNIEYVLYKQLYDEPIFWIRPSHMFFEKVTDDNGEKVNRFTNNSSPQRNYTIQKHINKLINQLENEEIVILHSETKETYKIVSIYEENQIVNISNDNNHPVGYLSDRQLAARLGYDLCKINGITHIFSNEIKDKSKELLIGDNNEQYILNCLNSCSIDLRISGEFFKSKRKTIDTHRIDNLYNPNRFWKVKKSSKQKIKLKPGKSILTHTKDVIKIPTDCAGKVEIKSSFARLSLSITSGDFCNPGYYGKFPLEITNDSNHTIILYEGEMMAQLILIPLSEEPIIQYSQEATFINDDGVDDGTPFRFFEERSIRKLSEPIKETYKCLYENLQDSHENVDVNLLIDRFKKTFPSFCQRKKKKYLLSNNKINVKELCHAYIRKERFLKRISNNKVLANILGFILAIIPSALNIYLEYKKDPTLFNFKSINPLSLLITTVIIVAIAIFDFVFKSKNYCTFEKKDIDKILENKGNS